ncbi:hypothetical protein H0H93_007974 [Arthromyces matolae]|nr:hypothetical protein H0H93_007974 [Arthromyces matolae]
MALPSELQHAIIETLQYDRTMNHEKYRVLGNCSLVSRSWLTWVRYFLFQDHKFSTRFFIDVSEKFLEDDTKQLISFLQSSHSSLASSIRVLSFRGPDCNHDHLNYEFQHGTPENYNKFSECLTLSLPHLRSQIPEIKLLSLTWGLLPQRVKGELQPILHRAISLQLNNLDFRPMTWSEVLSLVSNLCPMLETLNVIYSAGQIQVNPEVIPTTITVASIFQHLHTLFISVRKDTKSLLDNTNTGYTLLALPMLRNLHIRFYSSYMPGLVHLRSIETMGARLHHLTIKFVFDDGDKNFLEAAPISLLPHTNLTKLNLEIDMEVPRDVQWTSQVLSTIPPTTNIDIRITCGLIKIPIKDVDLSPIEKALLRGNPVIGRRRFYITAIAPRDYRGRSSGWYQHVEELFPELHRRGIFCWAPIGCIPWWIVRGGD